MANFRWTLMPLLATYALAQSDGSFQCSNSSSAAYNATFTSLGCYNDSSVSSLEAAKLSTIAAMAPPAPVPETSFPLEILALMASFDLRV